MRANRRMARWLEETEVCGVVLSSELQSVLARGFVEEQGCVVLASEVHNAGHVRVSDLSDETGYECFLNHIHIASLPRAMEFAQRLAYVLAGHSADRFVVIVSSGMAWR